MPSLAIRGNELRLDLNPFRREDLLPCCVEDSRTSSIFSGVLAVLGRPLRPLFKSWHVASRKNFRYVELIVRLVGVGILPQRPGHRLLTSTVLNSSVL